MRQKRVPSKFPLRNRGLRAFKRHECVHCDLGTAQLVRAAKLRQINDLPTSGQFKPGMQILVPAASVFSS